jgi:hypothetical protein
LQETDHWGNIRLAKLSWGPDVALAANDLHYVIVVYRFLPDGSVDDGVLLKAFTVQDWGVP